MKKEWNKKTLWILILAILFFIGGVAFYWFSENNHHGMGSHQEGQQNTQNLEQHEHDEVNMPGLQGEDINQKEIDDLKALFIQHDEIIRSVENLPNGIKTLTETKNEQLRENIIDHVTMMVTRLQEEKNPKVIIQSPTLHEIFEYYDEIETEIELTDQGIVLVQTSNNPQVVALLQQHAAEILDMVDRGMEAVHERMMSSSQ